MKKALLLCCLLLPLGGLLVWWATLPVRIPLHFPSNGTDVHGDKYVLWGLILVPLLVYAMLQFRYRPKTLPQQNRSIGVGVAVFLNLYGAYSW